MSIQTDAEDLDQIRERLRKDERSQTAKVRPRGQGLWQTQRKTSITQILRFRSGLTRQE
jgi:hypothetical protein